MEAWQLAERSTHDIHSGSDRIGQEGDIATPIGVDEISAPRGSNLQPSTLPQLLQWTRPSRRKERPQNQARLAKKDTSCTRLNEDQQPGPRSEEHTSELQSLMRISYAVFCLKKKQQNRRPRSQTRM